MPRSRTHSWLPAFSALACAGLLLAGAGLQPVVALELREEPLAVAEEQSVPETNVSGESVGETSAEDAPVEGEPGPGETVRVPPDEPGDGGDSGDEAGPPLDESGAETKIVD